MEITIEKLWGYACSGKRKQLQEYYDNGGQVNRKYHRFGKDHSLAMGAFRNGRYKTFMYLLANGEALSCEEAIEVAESGIIKANQLDNSEKKEKILAIFQENLKEAKQMKNILKECK